MAAGTSTIFYTTSSGTLCSSRPGAICRRTDSRGITTTYSYDVLNRLTNESYSDSTPAIAYYYDQSSYNGLTIANGLGRRTGMSDGSGQVAWSFDPLGNVVAERRTILGISKPISYSYNRDGSLATLTYPGGHVVSYSYSNAQRPVSVTDTGSNVNFIQNVTYAPHGAVASDLRAAANNFAGITDTYGFNNRFEPTLMKAVAPSGTLFSISPTFSLPGGNNGTVTGYTDGRIAGRSESYGYDTLDRISSAQTQITSGSSCWGQGYGYDRWGNLLSMTPTQCTAPSLSVSVDPTTNHVTGYSYDAAGNVTNDGLYTYSWNAENELTSAAGKTYTYDGDYLRVAKANSTLYWRSVSGGVIAETDATGSTTNTNYFEYIYFAGRRVARRPVSGGILHYYSDQVGSTRVIYKTGDNVVCFDSDYTPFGYEVPAMTSTCPQNYKFATYERDAETGLDYAMHRYYSSRLGRFLSPDPIRGEIVRPQSLNRYEYVLNDPCTLVDPLGLDPQCTVHVSVQDRGNLTSDQIQAIEQQIRDLFSSAT